MVARYLVMSIAALWHFAGVVSAHELNPTVANFEVAGQVLSLELRLNAEAILTEIDLDEVTDTDASAKAEEYDALLARPGPDIEALFATESDAFLNDISLFVGGAQIPLQFLSIETPSESVPGVGRQSIASFIAELPSRADSVSFAWGDGMGPLVIRQFGVDDPFTGFISGGDSTGPISLIGGMGMTPMEGFVSYIPVGFDHILPKGLDHILFVLGLFFLSLRWGSLLWQVTAFTAAHTVTLALGALGYVNLPGHIVEPIIAASIVYVGVENILSNGLSRWRPYVVFLFGLLHGLGFASVLGDFGLPTEQFIPALLGFNVGVELGQLTVIAIAYLVVGYNFGKKPWYRSYISNPASALIAFIGAYWVIERVFL
ncbi:HupE / UreJ protein [Cognatishimia maritima]|uniref:HupE / UreJ protein n=2 Tax=Cognatishimia maritima TaxID=870908 RepID=A0A1M5ID37_9RHOB|nr:HupE / UreJ protein [Cognatishimia maritima]